MDMTILQQTFVTTLSMSKILGAVLSAVFIVFGLGIAAMGAALCVLGLSIENIGVGIGKQ